MKTHLWARQTLAAGLFVLLLFAASAKTQTPSRVVAIADIHGAYPQFVALLQTAGLIDAKRQWIGGSATLVQMGDVIDRGAQSRECLDLLMALESQAPKKGGAVIPLLGNHEVMNVMGQLAYVTPEMFLSFAKGDPAKTRDKAFKDYVKFLTLHAGHGHTAVPPADDASRAKWMDEHPLGFVEHRDAFAPKGKYGKWIRSRHAVVQVGDGIFLHGGLKPSFGVPSVREVDERVMSELGLFDAIWQALVEGKVVWRYMTYSEAVQFVGEEAAWLKTSGGAAVPRVTAAMQRLLSIPSWMVATFPEGPLWDRGLSDTPDESLAEGVTSMLAKLQARYIVVGHTPQANSEIVARLGNRVFLTDTGMLPEVYQGRATALEIQNGRFRALSTDRPAVELSAPGQ